MLIVGTRTHLEDLEREYTLADDVSVTAVAVTDGGPLTPGAPGTVYVLLDGQRICRVEEFHVEPVASLSEMAGQSMAGGSGRLLVGTAGAHLLVADPRSGELVALESFDSVPGRDSWKNPAAASPDLRSIAVSGSGAWLAAVHVGGLWRSTDRGVTWNGVLAPEVDVHEVAVGEQGRAAVAAAGGLGWSTDDGVTFRWTTEGLHARYARAVALDGDMVFVTASTGPGSTDGRLYRGRLGQPLEQCPGLPAPFPFNLDSGCLTARDGQVAVGTPEGHVYRSSDGGSSFDLVNERLGPVRVLRFV